MHVRVGILLPLVLAACTKDVRSIQLSELDFSDARTLQQVERDLSAEERAAFTIFVTRHLVSSASFCGRKLIDENGAEPATVGEAVALTLARTEQETRLQSPALPRGAVAAQSLSEQWDELSRSRDFIISQKSFLVARHGDAARRLPQWEDLEAELARYNDAMRELRSKVIAGTN